MAHAEHFRKIRRLNRKINKVPYTKLDEHYTHKQSYEQSGQIAVSVAGTSQKQIFKKSFMTGYFISVVGDTKLRQATTLYLCRGCGR